MTMQIPDQKEEMEEEENFLSFLQSQISKADYDQLPELLEITKRKFKRLENNPREWTGEQLDKLVKLLTRGNADLNYMVDAFKMGYDQLSVDEYLFIKRDDLPF